ncbi:GPW/gp25 family protein [Novispirillum itersonii]|uniref:GPW/gp25 family protein n=1 Tax=Novispirillum itersonii TaxID=189 RepID=UPI00036966F4|nr:GPW/gp25 family protein [Novispirillum itersonii]
MAGMNATTGQTLDGLAHIRQSVTDILMTPLGSLLWRPEYGSLIPGAIDRPMTADFVSWLAHETAIRLRRWEDRWILRRSVPDVRRGGQLLLTLDGTLTESGERYVFDVEVKGR